MVIENQYLLSAKQSMHFNTPTEPQATAAAVLVINTHL